MDPIIVYLKEEKLPEDKFKARNLILKIVRYVTIAETLYKRGFLMPYLRCLARKGIVCFERGAWRSMWQSCVRQVASLENCRTEELLANFGK